MDHIMVGGKWTSVGEREAINVGVRLVPVDFNKTNNSLRTHAAQVYASCAPPPSAADREDDMLLHNNPPLSLMSADRADDGRVPQHRVWRVRPIVPQAQLQLAAAGPAGSQQQRYKSGRQQRPNQDGGHRQPQQPDRCAADEGGASGDCRCVRASQVLAGKPEDTEENMLLTSVPSWSLSLRPGPVGHRPVIDLIRLSRDSPLLYRFTQCTSNEAPVCLYDQVCDNTYEFFSDFDNLTEPSSSSSSSGGVNPAAAVPSGGHYCIAGPNVVHIFSFSKASPASLSHRWHAPRPPRLTRLNR